MSRDRKRVLLVDDSPLIQDVTRRCLESAGYAVVCARDLADLERLGFHGDADVEAEPVDLILMDVNMPEAFGDDIAMVLRVVRGVEVPILLLSSLDPEELERRAAGAEIEGFISKRAGLEEVVRRVRAILGPAATTGEGT